MSLSQLNNTINDYQKDHIMNNSNYNYYRILVSQILKNYDINKITEQNLIQCGYKKQYTIQDEQVLINQRYINNLKTRNKQQIFILLCKKFINVIHNIKYNDICLENSLLKI